jgi:Zn-dependent protease with chaperone function
MLTAFYYDGRTAQRHPVHLHVADGALCIEGGTIAQRIPLSQVDFGEPLGKGPRCIELPEGARCEVADHQGLERLQASAGVSDSTVVKLQRRWRWAVASFVIVVASAFAGYQWGLPALAKALAPHIPAKVAKTLSDGVFAQLDARLLAPSTLSPERQEEIRRLVVQSLAQPGQPAWRIHFRSSPKMGANALALPSGDIIVLDKLVMLMNEDRQLTAVVAHEIGHLAHHHSMQQLIQGTAVSLIAAVWFGDVSSAAVALSGQLLQAGYSRIAEREADAFAVRLLLQRGGSALGLIESLEKLAKSEGDGGPSLFSSHPDTPARIVAIRALAAGN